MTQVTDNSVDPQDGIDGNGDAFSNKAAFYSSIVPSESLAPVIPLANFIGLADLVYDNTVLNQSSFSMNGTQYAIVARQDDPSNSYQGFVLYDAATNSVFVVNRGSQEAKDFVVDATMAVTAVNSQWSDALALANVAAAYASSHNNATVYAVGHSLGGSLAELQAADFGWVGYTFNAYGASDVFNALGLTQNPNASIHNYRTLFDVVSDASTHLGDQPIVLESAADVALLASGSSASPEDLIKTIAGDHSLSNFFAPGSDASSGDNYNFVPANAFSVPASGQMVALAEDLVSGLALSLRLAISAVASGATGATVNIPVGDLTVAQAAEEAWQYMNDQSVSGVKAIAPSDPSLLSNALNSSTSNNVDRASLAMLSPVVLQGVDLSQLADFALWAPGMTTGLTKDYLIARNDMVQAMIAMAGQGQVAGGSVTSSGANTYVYSDLGDSPSPMYTLDGKGGQTYDVVFAGATGSAMTATPGAYAELFGGAGNDTLFGGTLGSTLQGGAGDDDYVIDGSGAGVDYILDTDGSGEIEWKFADGSTETLTGGDDQEGTSSWKSADGLITYSEDLAADGSNELEILSGSKAVYVDAFTNGELGINLTSSTTSPPSQPLQIGLGNSYSPGEFVQHEFDNDGSGGGQGAIPIGSTLTGPVDTLPGDIWEINAANYAGNSQQASAIFGGTGDELIYANAAPAVIDAWNSTVAGSQAMYILAGSGAQSIVGGLGNDTLIGGADTITAGPLDYLVGQGPLAGSESGNYTLPGVTGFDWIAGGGGNDLIESGVGGSLIFGGVGADTIIGNAGNDTIEAGYAEYPEDSFADPGYTYGLTESGNALAPIYEHTASDGSVSFDQSSANGIMVGFDLSWSDGGNDSVDAQGHSTVSTRANLIVAGTGNDFIQGGGGNDTIEAGSGSDTIIGGDGNKTIYGGTGGGIIFADESLYQASLAGNTWQNAGATYADSIYGGSGVSTIYGSGGNDQIFAGGGNDQIVLGNGDNYVSGDSGNVTVTGGAGNDTIDAGTGNDLIRAGSGNVIVYGGMGNSTIYAGAGSDTVVAEGGYSTIFGGSGTDSYLMGPNTGFDTISRGTGETQLQLVDGLTESSLVVRNVNGDLVLSDPDFGSQVTVLSYFSDTSGVQLQFADGTIWNEAQIAQASMTPSGDGGNDTLVGSNGNDSITAGYGDTSIVGVSGDNTLTGGAGADTIQGGSGADTIEGGSGTTQITGGTGRETYVFNLGDGSDTIWENTATAGNDTLTFDAGISASDLSFVYDSSTNILLVQVATTGQTITVSNFVATQSNQHQISTLAFADGTAMSQLQVIQQAWSIDGTAGSDSLIGTSSANYFDGLGGNDTEVGEGGNDTFVFNFGYGQLEVNETYASGQVPVLQLGVGITASSLHVASDGTSLILTDGVSGDQIKIDNMWTTSGDGVAVVQFADGSSLTAAQLMQMELSGTTGNDTIYGTPSADVIDGKGGNDVEIGEGGIDTFVFNAGYGDLQINESYTSGQQAVLQLGAGITASALRVTASGNNLLLTDGVSGDQITLDNANLMNGSGVAIVQLADGTAFTASQLIQMSREISGTTGNDTLYGTSGADLIDGKGGDDVEYGEGGNDTFVFDPGYGQLEFDEDIYTSGQTAVLQLGAGITASALHVSTNGNSLFLTDGITGDEITVESMWSNPDYGIQSVHFADGTTLTAAQLFQMETTGTTGSDTIYGIAGGALFDGKGGGDVEIGDSYGGNDTFVFNAGYGHLEVSETYGSGQQPILKLGAGITEAALHVTTDGANLFLTDGITGDQIELDQMWYSILNGAANGGDGVAAVQLTDGTTLTLPQLTQMEVASGTAGSDTIYGTSGADLINGNGGNDVEYGKGGNDTFVFNAGYGQLSIANSYSAGDLPVLQLGAGITVSNLKVLAYGSNLYITDGVRGDDIALDGDVLVSVANNNGYAGVATISHVNLSGIGEIKLDDGTVVTADQLAQMAGNTIYGTSGNDTLGASYSTPNGDYIDGRAGNDLEVTSGGNDTFVFNAGYGQLEISGAGASGWGAYTDPDPVLQLGGGITASNLRVTTADSGYYTYLTDGVSGDEITLVDMGSQFNGAGSPMLQLADGTTLTMAQLIWASLPQGTTGNDTLVGTWGGELIDGKGGNDSVTGEGGSDTFVFDAGYGQLSINESYLAGQQPVLQLGAGITVSDLQVTSNGQDLIITDGTSGDQIVLHDMLYSGSYGVATVQLVDGTTLTAAQLLQMEMTGTAGNDTIFGTPGAHLLDGKGGNDLIYGDGASDTFVFNAGYGDLEINDFYSSGQQPVLQLGAGIAASALHATSDGRGSVILTDGISGDQITLDNELSENDGVAVVAFADGTTLTSTQLIQMETTGTTGNDTLYGSQGADLIDGKGGSDSMVGNGGNDTFVFNAGYGDLEINETYTSTQQPVLQLGAGITVSALRVTESGSNLVVTDGISGDQITLDNMWSTGGTGVATVLFADGTSLTAAQLIQMEMTGTAGNDTITGTSGADLIDGKGGSDSVVGNGGSDTFVFNSGYGHLEINEAYTSGQLPVLQLGAGITASALHATKSGNNLVLTDGVSGDQVTLDGMWTTATDGVASLQLSGGTTLTRAQMIALEMTGTTGNDTITGTSGADLIDGKGGSDSVVGGGGNDTFVFNSGYGHLEINEVYTSGQVPELQLGTGITASALHVTTNGTNVVLTDGVSGDQVTLDKMWSTSTDGVASAQLADGTTLTRSQLIQMEMTGTTGNDTIYGTTGADVINGKGGSDSVTGDGGNDTFVFNSGYGRLTINETYTSGQTPVLQLGAGITTSTLKVAKSGNNLVLTDGVTGDQITLTNMSSSSTAGVATVNLASGASLTRSQLIGMEAAVVTAPVSTQSATVDSAKVNSLIYAIASYTGEGADGSITSVVAPSATPDLMLHSAA